MKPTSETVIVTFDPAYPSSYSVCQYKVLDDRTKQAVYWNQTWQAFSIDLRKI